MKKYFISLFVSLCAFALFPFTAEAYNVVKGDTLWQLSRECGVTVNELAQYNGIKNPDLIRVGQEIKCPLLGAVVNRPTATPEVLTFRLLSETPRENPPSGFVKQYYKDDGFLYQLDSAGNETIAGGGGGGGDMYKAVYDTDDDGKADTAALADNSTLFGGQASSYYATASNLASTTSTLNTHTANTSNPHSVTATQVGAYSTASTDALLANKVASSTTVNGHALNANVTVTASDVSLGNVDNTSDATKNAASATLTNKTINATNNTISNLDTTHFASGIIDTDTSLTANSDTRLATQKAIKAYADALRTNTAARQAVQVATTEALPACTYDNGSSGVGATLTANSNGAITIDSVSPPEGSEGSRVLIKDQANAAHNGVYTLTQIGSVSTPWILTRATDFDQASNSEAVNGAFFPVYDGVENSQTLFMLTTATSITFGSTDLNFTALPTAGTYTASNGVKVETNDFQTDLSDTNPSLEISDGGLRAKVDNSSIERSASGLQVKAGGVTNTMIATSAGIPYSKLNLGTSILNSDINSSAAIAESKLNLTYGTSALNTAISTVSTTVSGKLGTSLNNGWVLIGNGSNVATPQPVTGDVTISNVGVTTIGSGEVTNDMLAGSIADTKLGTITTADKVAWIAVNKTGSTIDSIADVNTTGVSDGNCLIYESGSSSWVDGECTAGGGGSGASTSTFLWKVLGASYGVAAWSNMPTAETEIYGNQNSRIKLDLTNVTQYRVSARVNASTAGADLNLEYSTNNSTFFNADTGAAGEVNISGSIYKIGNWTDLVAGAKSDVFLRIVGKDGDGVADPSFAHVYVEFRGPVGSGATEPYYAEMYKSSNTIQSTIGSQNDEMLVGDFTEGTTSTGWSMSGSLAGPITATSNPGGGKVQATSAGHSLANGDIISITGTTDYDGVYVVSGVSGDNFQFTDTYVSNQSGEYVKGSSLVSTTGADGVYEVNWSITVTSTNPGDDYDFKIFKNATAQTKTVQTVDTTNGYVTASGGGLVSVTAGDIISFGVKDISGANNPVIRNANIRIKKL